MPGPRGARRVLEPLVSEGSDSLEAPMPAPEARAAPRVRTLLLCDLADSTALVERLGDVVAADLMRRHDRRARDLLHRFEGREIDKTDGFLLLFERPVQAVGFALAYQHALHELGRDHGQTLNARVGIHVGEVVVWENEARDVADGAKRLEVEGLAKPVAARLMQLAVPGQILLSGVAFTLAQRAAPELERATELRWLTHGRYRFKGVAAPMLVHEVGLAGLAPLQAPPSTSKAQRDVPLWRRPAALALEAIALLAAVAIPFALSLRATPAIAFAERDWIVVGELRNLTGETLLDDSLQTAFRISLEQSRYVNVLSDLKLRDTLARMQKPADTAIDRGIASEIALREGARAVILPTVAEIGGRVRVSAEVIDPHTQTTVYAESADGVGAASALDSIDHVTHTLREKLGEALASIEKDSAPLPKVTSGNLDALRAYALGDSAYARGQLNQARELFESALALDPEFALAFTGLARTHYRNENSSAAAASAERALALADRLSARDRLYVQAWAANFGPRALAVDKWRLLTSVYPDHLDGVYNLALYQWLYLSRADDCIETTRRIDISQYPHRGDAVYLQAICQLGADRIGDALSGFARATQLGVDDSVTLSAAAHAAQRDFAGAWKKHQSASASAGLQSRADHAMMAASIKLDEGDLAGAMASLDDFIEREAALPALLTDVLRTQSLLIAASDGFSDSEALQLRGQLDSLIANLGDDPPASGRMRAFLCLTLGLTAARSGDISTATQALHAVDRTPSLEGFLLHLALRETLEAELASAANRHEEALAIVRTLRDPPSLLQQEVTAVRVLAAAGKHEDAAMRAERLALRRGRAYAEWGVRNILLPMNVASVDLALLQAAEASALGGNHAKADSLIKQFQDAWPNASQAPAIADRINEARSTNP